ncbi:UDP-N-acetyl-D-mannosamine dehydrogenase [Sulfurovum sp.]|jgi:UDP-N-acetyl-D-mannosaminuronic acid dehydrogenase|uniref:UDP-N-acetyl-D-mannosamine dehydrogenase n=1 Tax=Sulfurovum sp. TaxID=1969726 RepID=UPI002A36DAC0|nr:UDP-N-acetyl-D-mannosamine dehydrogenase [Sulfurovum sp.]MDY0402785.1 UDP-N-acetyl-D-mannosamine dehydrogenase [Sulfurovum sp.]
MSNNPSSNPSTHNPIHPSTSKVCVVGLGYIGLPTAALLANRSYQVHGVDVVQSTVDTINRGEIHIVEPELDTFVRSAVNSGKLVADTKPVEADIFIIAVPTPFHEGYVPNIDYVVSATKSIAPYIKEGDIVILESTSPVGTTDKVEEVLAEMRPELFPSLNTQRSTLNTQKSKIFVSHCPERVLPGHIMRELVENDRIVGGTTPEATEVTVAFYKTFVEGEVLATDAKTAEMAKLTENSFRDTNIAFANELSILCDKFDIDVWELIALANRHPRVNILQPGAGVGGHCIAVDPWFIVHAGGEDAKMIRTAREVNTYKTEWAIEKIKNAVNEWKLSRHPDTGSKSGMTDSGSKREPKVAVMGLAFKPDIDDLRESPALYITRRLIADGLDVLAVEPNIESFKEFDIVEYQEAVEKADVVTFLVAHKEFKNLNVQTELDFCGVLRK